MKLYSLDIVEQARQNRKKGASLRAIEKKLNIPNSTISKWVRDIKSNNFFYKKARLFENKNKSELNHFVENYKFSKNEGKILIALLYWCEGSKYPSSNCIAFSNSDQTMMKTFIVLLRKSFDVNEEKLRVRLQLHSTHNIDKEFNYWSSLLDIPIKQFGKPTITNPTRNMKRLNYRGTCTIKYYDVKLLLNIIGIYESFSKRFILGEVA